MMRSSETPQGQTDNYSMLDDDVSLKVWVLLGSFLGYGKPSLQCVEIKILKNEL